MAINEIHQNDIGTKFKLTIKDQNNDIVDLSSAITKEIIFKTANNSSSSKSAAFFTDGTDGIITYTTVANDLKSPGSWSIQAKVVLPSGTWHSDIQQFTVFTNL